MAASTELPILGRSHPTGGMRALGLQRHVPAWPTIRGPKLEAVTCPLRAEQEKISQYAYMTGYYNIQHEE